MKICIGIVTFNNSNEQLLRLFSSIAKSFEVLAAKASATLSILGIDNGQACFELAKSNSRLPSTIKIQTLPTQGNIGFGRAMNVLMKHAFETNTQSDVFIAVNPDGLMQINCLNKLIEKAQATDGKALLEARQFPEEHPKPYSCENGDTSWATGACLVIPKSIFEKIGGFDENLFMYAEDVDLSWRARAAGFGVKVVHDAIFMHPTLGRVWSKDAKKHFFLSAVYLAHKWRAEAFKQQYEDDYRTRFGQNAEDLELLAKVIQTATQASNEIVNSKNFEPFFDKNRSFSKARWGY